MSAWDDPTERRMRALEGRVERAEMYARRAMADRDRLASLVDEFIDWFHGADHHPGCSGAFPPHRCKCGRDRLLARIGGDDQ